MGIFDPDEVITVYSLKQAIEDGVLVEIFKNRWRELSGGKPIVATANLFEEVSLAGLLEIWNEFVCWGGRGASYSARGGAAVCNGDERAQGLGN